MLLTEYRPFKVNKQLAEQAIKENKPLIVSGVIQRAEAQNQNGRVYPTEILQREIKNYIEGPIAEKRAKDRVVLKLVDLSGNFYSEDEADDFKDAKPQGEVYEPEMIDFLKEAFTQFMVVQHTKEEVQSFYKNNSKILGNLQANHNSVYEEIKTVFKDRIKEIQNLTKGDKNG